MHRRGSILIPVMAVLIFFTAVTGIYFYLRSEGKIAPIQVSPKEKIEANIAKFGSVEEFKTYLENSQASGGFGAGIGMDRAFEMAPNAALSQPTAGGGSPDRFSQTNVQVAGIDEPDIVKTDGKTIYKSTENLFYIMDQPARGAPESLIYPPPTQNAQTQIVSAFPLENLGLTSEIDYSGELLLSGKNLIIFSPQNNSIRGYSVEEPKTPFQKWSLDLDSRNRVVTSRLYNDKIYLVTSSSINHSNPCPIPLATDISVPCTDIYHPVAPAPTDATYTGMVLDPATGKVDKTVSFLGSTGQSVIYMSPDNLFITYSYTSGYIDYIYDFIVQKGSDLFPSDVAQNIKDLKDLNISDAAKMTELSVIMQNFQTSLSDDERLKFDNEYQNRLSDYAKEHVRDLEKTGIVKIGLSDLEVDSTALVPGRPLNNFSIDEYQNHLRIATTSQGGFWGGGAQSVNDVYILDSDLSVTGQILDLGITERIYSARFIGDRGYLVTFRQIDPFYVLDLSNPKNPQKTGELKIPGFSSYLHPLSQNMILGVGQEGSGVKLSLFDVSDPKNPSEKSKYNLSEFWTEVQNNYHAFLQDPKHNIFFIPGGQGGYIFSYNGDNLSLAKAVSDHQIRRALFIDDYLYLVGDTKITVLSEATSSDWSTVSTLGL